MNRIQRLTLALTASLIATTPMLTMVNAQNIAVTFYADVIDTNPGKIEISNGYLTILDFYGPVDTVIAGKPGLLKVEAEPSSPNRVVLSTLATAGKTDLVVSVEGRLCFFSVEIGTRTQSRKYTIEASAPTPPPRNPPRNPINPPTIPNNPGSITPSGNTGVVPVVREVSDSIPSNIKFELSPGQKANTLIFSVQNNGTDRLVLDQARLNIKQDGTNVGYLLTKDRPPQGLTVLRANETVTGNLAFNDLKPGSTIELTWQVRNDGGTMELKKVIQIEP